MSEALVQMGTRDTEAPRLFALADFECICGGNSSGKKMGKDEPTAWAHQGYKLSPKVFQSTPWNKRGAGKGCLLGVIIHVPVCLLNGAAT